MAKKKIETFIKEGKIIDLRKEIQKEFLEKAIEWLETINFEKDYIDVAYEGCFFKAEDFINDFRKIMEE